MSKIRADECGDLAQTYTRSALSAPVDHLSDVASWHAHVPFAFAFMAIHKPRLTVELGVHKGDSFFTFCRGLSANGLSGRVVGIDCWEGDAHAGFYNGDAIYADVQTRLARGFSDIGEVIRRRFDDAIESFADGEIDLLHIDGLHTYDAVKHDFESWRAKLSDRGVVLFHDTCVREKDFGVWRLWEDLSKAHPSYEFRYGHGLGVLLTGNAVPEATRSLVALLNADQDIVGLSVRDVVRQYGQLLEARGHLKALRAAYSGLDHEFQSERQRAMAEINRLNAAIEDEREAARLEFERLGKSLS